MTTGEKGTHDGALGRIEALFANEASANYLGEAVTTAQHMLQAAARAEALGAGPDLVVAALLHDVGHFLRRTAAGLSVGAATAEGSAASDRPAEHAGDGAEWLAQWFGPAVTEPIRLHVGAKRYLCSVEPGYRALLSAASVRSLELQGGPMGGNEAAAFAALPYASDAVLLRRCDEWAKNPELETPGLDHYVELLRSVLRWPDPLVAHRCPRPAADGGGPADRSQAVTIASRGRLLRRGMALEGITLGWNVVGVAVLAFAAIVSRSVAIAGFGLDSLIEIGASVVVIWELTGSGERRQAIALRIIGGAFMGLALYLAAQSTVVLVVRYHPHHSPLGIGWTAVTAVVMFALAAGKGRIGRRLDNPVLRTEARVTLVDAVLASAVLVGLVLNARFGWWWADPLAGYVILVYGLKEARTALRPVRKLAEP